MIYIIFNNTVSIITIVKLTYVIYSYTKTHSYVTKLIMHIRTYVRMYLNTRGGTATELLLRPF